MYINNIRRCIYNERSNHKPEYKYNNNMGIA